MYGVTMKVRITTSSTWVKEEKTYYSILSCGHYRRGTDKEIQEPYGFRYQFVWCKECAEKNKHNFLTHKAFKVMKALLPIRSEFFEDDMFKLAELTKIMDSLWRLLEVDQKEVLEYGSRMLKCDKEYHRSYYGFYRGNEMWNPDEI